ncbi:glycosyltransferase family 2 protein [Actinomadura sp. GC306]|uniref:glycosyltransferase n=1 Tax=Actinomadura sp. GC306 TaxID=2530367 RepID=UPI0010467064|nr:glycosyltransferase [Actinomadura sp. GC306]TDC61707.1 glycosyltransferase family 2 protein [Actinomadura sp. GC306]
MTSPKVSVIVPVYNCRPTVETTLRSVSEQTLAGELIEVIAVDDGSTDGSGDELDALAESWPWLSVVRQPNSGGPGGPRNTGIDRARGEYLFFLDADDHLGPDALRRLCAMADEHGTDIVIGNYVGVGRGVARFEKNIPHVTVDDPKTNIYGRSLTAHKLFRRDLVQRHGVRFPEGLLSGEDKVFTAHALLHSTGVSVVADYDCYYLVERDDGTSIMQSGGAPAEIYYPRAARPLLEHVMSHREPGAVRDRMLVRHFQRDVLHRLDARLLAGPEQETRRTVEEIRALCEEFLTESVLVRMPPRHRILAHCARFGHDALLKRVIDAAAGPEPVPVKVDKDRAHARYPGFREPAAAVPDAYYDITDRLRIERTITALGWDGDRLRVSGTAAITRLGGAGQVATLLLRSKKSAGEHRVAVERDDDGGFTVDFSPTSVASGTPEADVWDLHLEMASGRLVKEARLGADRAPEIGTAPPARFVASKDGEGAAVTPFFTREYGNLSFSTTPGAAGLKRLLAVDEVTWDDGAHLRVRGHIPASADAASHVGLAFGADRRGGGDTRPGRVDMTADGDRMDFTAILDARALAEGRWDVWLEVTVADETSRMRLPVAEVDPSPPVPCAALGMRRASFYRTNGGNLAVQVVPGSLSALTTSVRRRLRRT